MQRRSRRRHAFLLSFLLLAVSPIHAPKAETIGSLVEFKIVAPRAKSVAVAGSFNGWSSTANPLQPSGSDGSWSARISIPPGEYRFMYVLDQVDWKTPAGADDFMDDGFGQVNGVLVVR